jgi:HlyD family secretion protein
MQPLHSSRSDQFDTHQSAAHQSAVHQAEVHQSEVQILDITATDTSETASSPPTPESDLSPIVPKVLKSVSRRPLWLGFGLGAVLLGGTMIWRLWPAPQAEAAARSAPPPRPVEMTTLTLGAGNRPVQLLGQVVASQQATVRSQVEGVIQQMLVNAGDRVAPGQVIAVLDPATQTLAVAEARARLAQERSQLARLEVGTRPEVIAQRRAALQSAQAKEREAQDNLRRLRGLVREGAVAERLLVEAKAAADDAKGERLAATATLAEAVAGPIQEEIAAQKANVAAAQAALNQAQLGLERTQIRAITAGTVQTRALGVGDLARSGDAVLTLVAANGLEVFLELPEDLSGQVQPGTSIRLRARALPQWQGAATITSVVPVAEASSRRQRIRVVLSDSPPGLLPGMSIMGQLALPMRSPGGFVISRDALTRRQNQWLVFTVAENKAKPVPVQMIADMGETVVISSRNLQPGQQIVLRGGDGLNEGIPVKILRPQNEPSPRSTPRSSLGSSSGSASG